METRDSLRTTGFIWRVTEGDLPPGLRLNLSSDLGWTIGGTPSREGRYRFTLTVYEGDAANAPVVKSCQGEIVVEPSVGCPANLGSGYVGLPYSAILEQSAKTGTVWAVANGALPPGLRAEETWSGTEGRRAWEIRGTPSREGLYRFTITSSIDGRQVNSCPAEILVYSGPLIWVVGGGPWSYGRSTVSSLGFSAASPGNAVLILQTTQDVQIPFTLSATAPWIRLNLTSGTTPFSFSVSVSDYSIVGFGAVRIDAPAAGNSPLIIPASVNGDRAKYTVTPSTLAFSHDIASSTAPTATLRVTGSPDHLNYEAKSESPWLKITPGSGSTPGDLAVSILPSGLRAGSYTGVIAVKPPYHDSPTVSVPVTLTVGSGTPKPTLSVTPASVTLNSSGSPSATLSLSSSGAGTTFTAVASGGSWLSVSPSSGATPATLTVSASASGLASGSYSGHITILSPDASNSPVTVPVTLTVPAPPPAAASLQVSPAQLSFSHETGGAAPSSQRVSITASTGTLNWSASPDRNWIIVAPVSGAATASGSSLSIDVNPTGLAAGSHSGSVTIAAPGASNSPRTVSVALTVTAAPPPPLLSGTLVIPQTGLTFTYQINGAPPAPQDVVVATTGGELDFRAAAAVTRPAGGRWLSVNPSSGTAPRVIKVAVNHSGLDAGAYEGTIAISAAGGSSTTLPVRFEVITPVSQTLSADVDFLSFSYAAAVGADTRQVTLTNPSFNQLRFVVDTATDAGSGWLRVSEKLGDVGATNPATLLVTADPRNLDPGTYTGTVRISSPYTDLALAIPVTMTVSGNRRRLQLSQTGLTFITVAGSGADDVPQDVGVLNAGQGEMPWTASVRPAAGAPAWLSVTPPAGTSVAGGEVPMLRATASAAGLAPGEYSGEVLVSAEGADNSPHPISVTLRVRPPGSDPGPALYPSGLIFTGVAGGSSPAEQTVLVLNRGGRETFAGASGFTLDGRNWLSYSPPSLRFAGVSVAHGAITVRVNTAGLQPGIYEGRVAVSFPSGVNRVLNVLLVISAAPGGKSALREAGAGCTPAKYVPLFTSIEDQFTVTAGAPSATQMLIVDDCGDPVSAASVGASFTNRDRSLSLTPVKDGRWSATWLPANSRQAAVTVNVTAADSARLLENGVAPASGFIRDRSAAPLIDRSRGLMNAASLLAGRPVAPGSMVVVTGEQLAARAEQFAQLPLPETLGGVSVTLGDRPVPLRSVSESRIEAVLPYDLPVNTTHQLVVRREGALSLPEEVAVAEAQPGIFTQEDGGRVRGKVFTMTDSGEAVLAGSGNPAQAGVRVVIVCTGLGAATQTVKVTIGGVAAEVVAAEVQADQPGIYLVGAIVPSGIAPGNDVPVQVSVAGQTSPPVTMALR